MKDIDWSKAPEGATHYGAGGGAWVASWYIVGKNTLAAMLDDGIDDEWDSREIDQEDRFALLPLLIARPTTPQWNGTGLPPVGVVCECQNDKFQWLRGEIVYVGSDRGDKLAVMQTDTEMLYGSAGEFRPIRTPKQIAAEERDVAVDAMCGATSSPRLLRRHAEELYDAGYRMTAEDER